jgi:hypothetical protein
MDWTHNKGQPFIAIPPAELLDAQCPCAVPVLKPILRGISAEASYLSPSASLKTKTTPTAFAGVVQSENQGSGSTVFMRPLIPAWLGGALRNKARGGYPPPSVRVADSRSEPLRALRRSAVLYACSMKSEGSQGQKRRRSVARREP